VGEEVFQGNVISRIITVYKEKSPVLFFLQKPFPEWDAGNLPFLCLVIFGEDQEPVHLSIKFLCKFFQPFIFAIGNFVAVTDIDCDEGVVL
jgi:hypothetical protein